MYKIIEVTPKSGEMRDIHKRMLNSVCHIIDLRKDCPVILRYFPDEMESRLAHTSLVEEVVCLNDGGLEIYTKNTKYVLKEIDEDAD